MGDVHLNNIFVVPSSLKSNDFQFFDNTRSFHHSNGLIATLQEDPINPNKDIMVLVPPIKSILLGFKESYNPFTETDRNHIKKEVEKYKEKLEALERYLNLPMTKNELACMPKGWFATEAMLNALKERILLIGKAIDDNRTTNLCDLTLASQPNLRFFAALIVAFSLPKLNRKLAEDYTQKELRQLQRFSLATLGAYNLNRMLSKCSNRGINVKTIKKLCDNPDNSFDDITRELIKLLKGIPGETRSRLLQINNWLFSQLSKGAKIDYKDISSKKIKK
jgi:hypothetical protein